MLGFFKHLFDLLQVFLIWCLLVLLNDSLEQAAVTPVLLFFWRKDSDRLYTAERRAIYISWDSCRAIIDFYKATIFLLMLSKGATKMILLVLVTIDDGKDGFVKA